MSTPNEPVDNGVINWGDNFDNPVYYGDGHGSEDSGSEEEYEPQQVVVTGKPVEVTLAHRVLRYISPVQDGVVVRTQDGQLIEEPIASPSVSLAGHMILSIFFLALVILYFVWSIVQFANRPETTVYLQQQSSALPGQQIKVTAKCTNPPHCGTMTIQSNYSAVGGCLETTTTPVTRTQEVGSIPQQDTATLDLCFVSDFVFSVSEQGVPTVPGILVDFSAVNPGFVNLTDEGKGVVNLTQKAVGAVVVESVTSSGEKNEMLYREVSLDAHQVKTLVIGRTITKKGANEDVVDDQMIPGAIQYEGKRINSYGATLFIRYDSFAVIERTKKEGTLLEVIANVGGCASVVGTLLLILSPVVALFLPGKQE